MVLIEFCTYTISIKSALFVQQKFPTSNNNTHSIIFLLNSLFFIFLQNVKKLIANVCPRPLIKTITVPPRSWITFLFSYDNVLFLFVLLLITNVIVIFYQYFRSKVGGRRQQYVQIPGTGTTELPNVVSGGGVQSGVR